MSYVRDARWTEAVAVGSLAFVEKVKSELEFKAAHRQVIFRLSADSVGIQNPKPVPSIDSGQALSNAEGSKIQNRFNSRGEAGIWPLNAQRTGRLERLERCAAIERFERPSSYK
jgi:hypothetical protein